MLHRGPELLELLDFQAIAPDVVSFIKKISGEKERCIKFLISYLIITRLQVKKYSDSFFDITAD